MKENLYTYIGRLEQEYSNDRGIDMDVYPKKPKSLFKRDIDNITFKFTYGKILKSVKLFKGKKYIITLNKRGLLNSIKKEG